MMDSITFYLILCPINLARKAARITNDLVDLSAIPTKYHEFIDVFSKAKIETLAPYFFYDLQIKLENRGKLPIRTIYLLSTAEQEVLKEFIYKKPKYRIYITNSQSTSTICQKEKWLFLYVHQLSRTQSHHIKRQVPTLSDI